MKRWMDVGELEVVLPSYIAASDRQYHDGADDDDDDIDDIDYYFCKNFFGILHLYLSSLSLPFSFPLP